MKWKKLFGVMSLADVESKLQTKEKHLGGINKEVDECWMNLQKLKNTKQLGAQAKQVLKDTQAMEKKWKSLEKKQKKTDKEVKKLAERKRKLSK